MEEKIFMDKNIRPAESEVKIVLKTSYKFWPELIKYIEDNFGPVNKEWKFYGKGGWNCKVLYKKRNLFFFVPYKGFFRIGFIFGEKAVSAVKKSDHLTQSIKTDLSNAKKYAEGRGIRIDVKNRKTLEVVKELVKIKIEH